MLIWKQWLIEKRNPFKSGSEVSLPILVSMGLFFINTFYSTTFHEDVVFSPYKIGIGSTKFSNTTELIYCPKTMYTEELINRTRELLGIYDVVSFENINAMNIYVKDEVVQERLFGGIQFHQTFPRLVVSLRFPEFRAAQGYNTSWYTNFIFPPAFGVRADMADSDEDIGPAPHYQRKGFLLLQEALSQAYIEYSRPFFTVPDIYMQRYPLPSWKSREVYNSKETIFSIVLFMFLSYILLFIGVIKLATLEKELQIKQALATAGVSNWMLWIAYFIRSLILFLFCFSVLLFALNTPPKQSLILFSNNLIVFLFFFCFSIASITLAFLISILHTSTVAAATVGAMLWFISFLPFYQLKADTFGGVVAYIFAPLAFFNAFDVILAFEQTKEGLQWKNLWKYPTPSYPYCFGYILISLTGCAVFYLLLALSIENGKFEKLLSYCSKCMRRKRTNRTMVTFDDVLVQEQPPSNLPLTVKTINLRKMYSGGFTAVENVSLEMYEDQITVLLGPNGAGKTTTANIIVGIVKPTQGFIRIYKSNVLWRLLGETQTYLGYCPQTNILFEELTVEEHIYFFSRIKGFDMINSIEEADKYITLLQLGDKASTAARYLTEGLRRRLSIALALCARSKLVVLDEPTAGVDPISKRAIWNMLYAEKKDRSILITTHLMEEAELLGDRIAIMCEGVLKCCGSSTFLKKQYAEGYSLVVVKGKDCSTRRVLHLMKKHVPNITIASDVGAQLCFKLEKQQSLVIENLLKNLEEKQNNLEIQSFRISMPTLEEVFIKNTVGYYTAPFDQVEETPMEFLQGRKLFLNRMLALLLKKFLLFKNSWMLLLMHFIFVLALAIISEITAYKKQTFDMPSLEIELKTYTNPVLLTDGRDTQMKTFYRRIVEDSKGRTIDTKDVSATIFAHINEDRIKVLHSYPAGATFFYNHTIIAWYNSFPYHSAPLALNLVMNTILRSVSARASSIEIYNHPLPLTDLQKALRTDTSIYGSLQYLMAIFSSMFIIFVIREAYMKSMRQQFVCGVHPTMYWLMTFFCDFVVYTAVVILVLITTIWLPDKFSTSFSHVGTLFLILLCYGFASLNLCYLIHRIFYKASTGYVTKILLCTAGIMLATMLHHAGKIVQLPKWVYCGFSFMPTFSLANALIGLNRFSVIERVCTMLFESCVKYAHTENCSTLVSEILTESQSCERSYYSLSKFGFLLYVVALVVFGTLFILINNVIDASLISRTWHQYCKKRYLQIINEEEDVIREREWVRKASVKEISERSVVLKDVSKTYKRKIALNRVSLAIRPFECFGLIGTHGAGKTSIFKILTGETYAYTGDVIVKGLNINKHMRRIREITAYCPQIDGLFNHLTGQQNLIIYSLIQGVPYKKTKKLAEVQAQKLDFLKHMQKTVKFYGAGSRRKLSTAIALLGNAQVILLDEPGAGMDVSTCKHLWAAICNERENGRTILLSTHSMEECEAVCDRIGMLVKGKIKCIGDTQRLTSKFAKDYILTIRCKKGKEENVSEDGKHKKLLNFVKENLPTAELLQSFKEVYAYQIRKEQSLSCATIFHIMDTHKTSLNIEDFILSQSSLEQVFLSVS